MVYVKKKIVEGKNFALLTQNSGIGETPCPSPDLEDASFARDFSTEFFTESRLGVCGKSFPQRVSPERLNSFAGDVAYRSPAP